jgi:protein tyrosine/serine phosphatase
VTDRTLRWPSCFNVRDLGGLPAADGQTTRWGALVRADLLCRLDDEGRQAMLAHGIRTVVDIRGASELAAEPNPFCETGEGGPLYLHHPVNEDPTLIAAIVAETSPSRQNAISLDRSRLGYARIVSAIATAPLGGVVFHCHAGKDRTGVVAALLLSLVGVPDETIVADYVLSVASIGPLTQQWLDRNARDADHRAELLGRAMPRPRIMLDTLAHLHSLGGAERYLLDGGATSADLTALRVRLLED